MLSRVVFVVWPTCVGVKHWVSGWDFNRAMVVCNALLCQLLVLVRAA